MSDPPPLPAVVTGDLLKPATVLIERISDAVGGLCKPYQIRRVAEAEADAEIIRARARIEVTDLERRALTRFIAEEAMKQANIESIAQQALTHRTAEAKPEDMERDWIVNFFDRGRLISDEDMQTLWGRILAGEANKPGAFSRRTVDLVASLDKSDAEFFSRLCSFTVWIGERVPLVYDFRHRIYTEHGVTFDSLHHLGDIGLIQFDALATFVRRDLPGGSGVVRYTVGTGIYLNVPSTKDAFQLGHVRLTQAGRQLATICEIQPREGFLDYLLEKWKQFGYKTDPDEETPASSPT